MTGGYTGKILFVDLSSGKISEETADEKLYRDFIGGYGVGAKILFDRQKAGVDPLGPENTLGIVTGPLTGTPAAMGSRYVVVAKSPLTGGWGDANSGGNFGPQLKFAGYDAIFFSGIAEKPVYLLINSGKAELKDASHLWGKDAYQTEDMLKDEHGQQTHVSCIGQSGENLALISCVITKRGAAAGRSGLGAVMGSKKLKAIAVKGRIPLTLADQAAADRVRKEYLAEFNQSDFAKRFRKYGTSAMTRNSALSGDTPVKNWGGIGVNDFPNPEGLSGDAAIANVAKSENCWHCTLACQAMLREGSGEYKYPAGTRRPEYETQASFGTMCLNDNTESIAMANHICNSYGLDTISAGCAIAFAIECYEHGIITREDTGGIELRWGDHRAIIAMTEKLAKREGLGDILADGVKIAAEKIGKGAEQFAVHIGGQELGMHDPKLVSEARRGRPRAASYQMDATPGRHTAGFGPSSFRGLIVNAAGLCNFGYPAGAESDEHIRGFMSAATGWDRSWEELLKCGERIANIRQAFNSREGINPLKLAVHPRIKGTPPQAEGPLKGVTADFEEQARENLVALDWDPVTAKPNKSKLIELGLDDVARVLWP